MEVTRATGSASVAGSDDTDVTATETRATGVKDWGQHPINIRFSIRTLLSRYYIVVLAGPERREKARRREERKRHPLFTGNNLWFTLFLIGLGIFISAVVGLALGQYIAFSLLGI